MTPIEPKVARVSRKVIAHPTANDDVARLRRLLGMIEAAGTAGPRPRWIEESPARPPVSPPTFRDMIALVEEREARRTARRRKHLRPVPA